jgi:glycerophosphoryl diester phosphodiesterase
MHISYRARRTALTPPIAALTLAASLAVTAAPAQALEPAGASAPAPAYEADRSVENLFPYPDGEFTLVNHRGLSPDFPENTVAAFRNSVALGADVIEIDLRPTQDGHIVIMHDATVDRTTDGAGAVRDLTLEQVRTLDAGSYVSAGFAGEQVPTFEEALEAVKGTGVRLLLDIKDSSQVAEIVRITEVHDMAGQVIVGPRTVQALQEFKALNPDFQTLGFIATQADATAFIDVGVDYIRLWPNWVTASRDSAECQADYAARVAAFENGRREHPGSASCIVQDVVSQGIPVWSTVNAQPYEDMDELLGLGVTGILSDLPAVLDGLLDDVEEKRFIAAEEAIAELRTAIRKQQRHAASTSSQDNKDTHLTPRLTALGSELAQANGFIEARKAGKACAGIDRAIEGINSAGLAGETAAELSFSAQQIKAKLACSRF